MEKKNTLLLTVVAVATLLVAVVGATFAYFASTVEKGDGAQFTANTAPMTSAFVATGSPFSLDVTADKMQSYDAADGKVAAESTEGTIVVTYASSVDGTAMKCSYDVFFNWTGTAYTAHSPLTSEEDSELYADKEFTIQASFASVPAAAEGENAVTENIIEEEKDWTEVTTSDDPEEKVKVGSAVIWSDKAGEENQTVHTWTYKSIFYNVPAYQNALAGQTFSGIFTVDNVKC